MSKFTRTCQRGLTIIELSIALAISAVMLAGVVMYAADSREKINLRNDAKHFSIIALAAEDYIIANSSDLLAAADSAGEDPTGSYRIIDSVSVDKLKSEGFLESSISDRLGKNGQSMTLLIKALPVATPDKFKLQGLLVSHGGQSYQDHELGQMVATAGSITGFISTGTTTVDGPNRSWTSSINEWRGFPVTPAPGHIAALVSAGLTKNSGSSDGNNAEDDQFLHRFKITGKPHLNQMKTNIDMDKNTIENVNKLEASKVMAIPSNNSTRELLLNAGKETGILVDRGVQILDIKANEQVNDTKKINIDAKDIDVAAFDGIYMSGRRFKIAEVNRGYWDTIRDNDREYRSFTLGHGTTVNSGFRMKGPYNYLFHVEGELWAGEFKVYSDLRKKKNLVPLSGSLDKLEKLQGYTFNLKDNNSSDIGLIAQEVVKVYPGMVSKDDEGFLGVSYIKLIAPLIEAVKELRQMIVSLQESFQQLSVTQNDQQAEILQLKADLHSQKQDLILLKQRLQQTLSVEESSSCGSVVN